MFRAGQAIIITKSNLPEHRHPNVGDKGFIGNAFYVVKYGFVLMEAYFYSYTDISEHRCERKIMAVDLTNDDSFVKFFPSESAQAIRKMIHNDGVYTINLCSPKVDILDTSEVHEIFNALYPWFERKNLTINKQIKIPLIKFRPLDAHDSVNTSPGVLCSWVNSMRPYIAEASGAADTETMSKRLAKLIQFEKPTAFGTIIYATPRQPYKWFLDIRKVAEVILIIRKLEALFRKNKKASIVAWIRTASLTTEWKRSFYSHYSGALGACLIGGMLDLRGTRPNTREALIEIYCMLLNSPSLEYAIELVKDIGANYFEVRGDYYLGRYKSMAQEVMNDQTKFRKGEKTIEEIFKTKYLK